MMTERIRIALIAACTIGLLAACGLAPAADEQALGTSFALVTAEADPETDTSVDTEAPPAEETGDDGTDTGEDEAPPVDETGDEGEEEGDGSGGLSLLIIAAIVLVIVAIGALLFRSGGRPKSSSTGQQARTPARSIDLDDQALGDISWFNEQLSLDLLSADPDRAVERWRGERPRIESLARDCQRLEESTANPIWGSLAAEVAALAQSLDTATMARSNPNTDPVVTRQAVDVVNRHRSQLSGLSMQVRRR